VHGLHDRHAVRVRGPHDPGRQQRVRIVQVQHVGTLPAQQVGEVALGRPAEDRRERQQGLLSERELADRVGSAQERQHLDPGRRELRDLRVDDDILAGRHGLAISVVRYDDLHARKRYR
jgi:hypothetical protein